MNVPPRMLLWACLAWLWAGLVFSRAGAAISPSWDLPPSLQTEGVFWREHWYERGMSNGIPIYTSRFRINAREASLDPNFGHRPEARENGLMLIPSEEDLFQLVGAELYAELWGGHPGTANKRVTVNGRSTYPLPRVGTEEGHCTYGYPVVPLRLDDLVNGWNAFQWAVDQGTTFWGHALIDQACLRVALTHRHPDLLALGLADVNGFVRALPLSAPEEGFELTLDLTGVVNGRIARVDFEGWYEGYDENGNRATTDWHGFTKNREPVAHLGSVFHPPFRIRWDTSMLPAQESVAVRARVRFKDSPGLVLVTRASRGIAVTKPAGIHVSLCRAEEPPKPFWSRDGKLKTCVLTLDCDPTRVERAELYLVTWTGGSGGVKDYFKFNGQALSVAEGQGHVIQYNRLPINPGLLRHGDNVMELLSDTEHHGIEVMLPGPALMVRTRE